MSLTVRKITPNIGAEIEGLDIANGIDEKTEQQLRDLLGEHYVLLSRNQKITPEQQVQFAAIFGQPESLNDYGSSTGDARTKGLPSEIFQITNDPGNSVSEQLKATEGWHTDLTWSDLPSKASVLHAQSVPSEGSAPQPLRCLPARL